MNRLLLIFPIIFLLAFAPLDEFEESKTRGKQVYTEYCITCHMGNGEGIPGAFPTLAGSDYLMEDPVRAIRGVKYGLIGEIVINGETYNSYMAPLGLEDQEIADVMNYIMNAWGNQYDTMITETLVAGVEE